MYAAIMFALLAFFLVALYRGARLITLTALVAAAFMVTWLAGPLGTVGAVIGALVLVPLAALLNVSALRRQVLTAPLFRAFRAVLPAMSDTEREALEAGDTWWEAELFRGRPDWSQLLDTPYVALTEDEQRFLDEDTDALCAMLDEWQIHFEDKDLPPEVWAFIRERGFFGMLIHKEHGGLGFSAQAQSMVVSKIATRSVTAAVTVMVPNSLGPGELLQHYGTAEQQAYWLPRLARGEETPCFALTGPEVGSDAGAIPDTGVVCRRQVDGESVLGIELTFDKRYITLAPVATVIGLAFRLLDPDGLLGDGTTTDYGITCALVPGDAEGLEIGRRHYPGGAFMNGPLRGRNVFVPLDAIIGGPAMAGAGWRMLVECLSAGRGISLPALATATGKGLYGATGAYTAIRRQFNVSIGWFEGVQEAMGRIGGLTYTLEASRTLTATALDQCSPGVITALLKYHSTEMMRQVVTDAMDIHGGRGVIMGPRNYLAIPWQLLPVAITVEGANIMTRSLMIFGQGAIRCHPYVYPEMEATRDNNLERFDRLFWAHAGYTVNRGVRAWGLALTGARLARAPVTGPLKGYYRDVERLSAALSFCSDVAMSTLGGSLKLRESTSARLGDILSQLYLATAVLKYYETYGRDSDDHLPHARWALDHALSRAGEALDAFCRNYPKPLVGRLLAWVVLPFGQPWKRPADALNGQVSELMMRPNAVSEALRGHIYVGDRATDPTGQLLETFEQLQTVGPAYERLLKAVSRGRITGADLDAQLEAAVSEEIIGPADADAIRAYDALRREAILTDDFDAEYVRDPLAFRRDGAGAGARHAG
ncbi:acyl-CoA dehydrogenase [Aquisalimonas asiatica]|uniref:Acyl-coenzyme A dehydrogenase n=1 Tax=Aquisalimonas asiatica TaxID=406100 RepID=A0A1H8TZT3_9GAMM|nr:acyl-CoA dehydrogenase [Aquisalimonas asiatica]SEO96509.1 acyl-CoA dehydrogenase [Aquisalimonas asiatica]